MLTTHIVLGVIGIGLIAFAVLIVWVKVGVWIAAGAGTTGAGTTGAGTTGAGTTGAGTTGAGTSGGAPEIDGVIFPPIFSTCGLFFALKNHSVPLWGYFLIWVATTTLLIGLMEWMRQIGKGPSAPSGKRRR